MILIHDRRLPVEYKEELVKELPGWELIPFGPSESGMYDSISCHPDMWFFRINAGTVAHAPALPRGIMTVLEESGMDLLRGESDPSGKYPETSRYNAARVGKRILHNIKYTDPVILKKAREDGIEMIDVTQGYTGCSIVPAGEEALITADRGIAARAASAGLEAMLIDPGHVELPGHEHGFIGGASGIMPDGTVFFLGDLSTRPDKDMIISFLERQGTEHIYIRDLPLFDAGGLFFF